MNAISLSDLQDVDWRVALSTYGNSHSSLIGLLVSWWIRGEEGRVAMEGGPSARLGEDRRGHCDGFFLMDDAPVGLIEVEGTRYLETLEKMPHFFRQYPTLQFGIFLAYPTTAQGRQEERTVPAMRAQLDTWGRILDKCPPDRDIFILGLEKTWTPKESGPLSINQYYQCTPSRVWGVHYKNGMLIGDVELAGHA